MSVPPLSIVERLDHHDTRVESLEERVESLENSQSNILQRLIAIEEQGKARAKATTEGLDRLEIRMDNKFEKLLFQLSEYTGAQKFQNSLAERNLVRWKQIAVIIGILGTVFSVLLSWQEVASFLWVKILHLAEPWSQ